MELSQLFVGIVMILIGVAIMFLAKFYTLSIVSGGFLIIIGIAVFLSKEDEIEKIKYSKSKNIKRKSKR